LSLQDVDGRVKPGHDGSGTYQSAAGASDFRYQRNSIQWHRMC
jgi:hypothetical protein